MEYVPVTDAARLLKKHGAIPIGRAVRLVCQLLKSHGYAHAKKFVHRDINPSNLLVTEVEGQEVAKLADFGLAKVSQSSRLSGFTPTGNTSGTVQCMSPEQITNYRDAKPPVDQYATGATLYNPLTGHFLYDFEGSKKHQLKMILEDKPMPIQSRRKDIPDGLAAVIHQALAREPERCLIDAKFMRKALLAFCCANK